MAAAPMPQKTKPVPFLDAAADFRRYGKAWMAALREIGGSGCFILGPRVARFEKEAARFLRAKSALALASGTDALVIALRAANIGAGDEVVTTPWSFFASAGAICRVGATPVFADIEPDYFTLNPEAADAAVTRRTRALLPVHLYGCPADMTALMKIARACRLAVIEDAAQAFGASWAGQYAGTHGDAGAFSFYPTKVLGGYGDGGLMVSRRPAWTRRARRFAQSGQDAPFRHREIGVHSRLDEVQAALLLAKLADVRQAIRQRRQVARLYAQGLGDLSDVVLPRARKGGEHVFGLYTLRVPPRARPRLVRVFRERGIGFGIYYPRPLHLQPALSFSGVAKGALPEAERAAREVISLPIFPGLAARDVERVCDAVRAVVR